MHPTQKNQIILHAVMTVNHGSCPTSLNGNGLRRRSTQPIGVVGSANRLWPSRNIGRRGSWTVPQTSLVIAATLPQ